MRLMIMSVNKQFQLLITDIDGTLIPFQTHEISDENLAALICLQESGVKVAIASGRVRQGIESYAEKLRLAEFGGFVISNNGAEIIDWRTKEVLYRNEMDPNNVRELVGLRTELGINCMLMQDDYVIMSGYDEAVRIDHDAVGMDFIWPYDMTHYVDKPTLRMNFTGDVSRLDEVEELFRKRFDGQLEIMRPQRIFLDVMSKGIDKGVAMKALADHLQIPLSAVVACGDGGNDFGMIRDAGFGVAMANAFDDVKAVAKVVAPRVEDHGLAWVVSNYF